MRALRLLGGAGGWAGFGIALGVLLALNGARGGGVAQPAAPDPIGPRRARDRAPAPAPAPAAAAAVAAPPARRPRAVAVGLRLLATLATWTVYGAALGLLLALTAPLAFGMRPLVVLSGSMEPVLQVGDATVVQRIAPHEARVGDVVTFKAPDGGRVTTHRVRAVHRTERGRFAFTTKGDANNAVERWTLPPDGELSRTVYRVPLVGHALLAIATPLGWALLVGLPLLALGVQEIARIWRRPPEPRDAPLPA